MQCSKPIQLDELMMVPCGKCIQCRIARSREWAVRILHETESHEDSIFVTLTYSDEALPRDMSIKKSELQRFLKRLRKQLEPRKIKYFSSGEYGSKTQRPHYHLIIFGMSKNDVQYVKKAWTNGLIHIGTVTYKSARYVAKYMFKQYKSKYDLPGREEPFALMSKGLGKNYCLKHEKQYRQNLELFADGARMGLPRYYKNLLEIESEVLYEKAKTENQRLLEHYRDKYGIDCNIIFDKVLKSRRQRDKNTMAALRQREDKI